MVSKKRVELAGDENTSESGQIPRGLWSRFLTVFRSWPVLLVAFAFAIMADPISSTAYAIEAALGRLNNDLGLILPTMGLVILVLAISVSVSSGASNIVAYMPELSPFRIVLALGLLLVVGVISWFGHSARSLFGLMAMAFVVLSIVVFIGGGGARTPGGGGGGGGGG